MKELDVAKEAAKEAGEFLLANFHEKKDIETKTRFDIVTNADRESERIILEKIRSNFPDHMILAEESGESGKRSDYMWVVDPLDGTTNYTVHNPFFNVSIALVRGSEVMLGVVYSPFTKELYHATRKGGAFCNDIRIRVSEQREISRSLIAYCHASTNESIIRIIKIFSGLKPMTRDMSRMRAGALELALVAAGRLEAYLAPDGYVWDSAAGSLLVCEAGGRVSDFEGKEWNPGKGRNSDILASNGAVHEKILDSLKKI